MVPLGPVSLTQGTVQTSPVHAQAVCIPFVGVIGNLYNRLILIAIGTVIWGAMSVGMGFAANYQEVSSASRSTIVKRTVMLVAITRCLVLGSSHNGGPVSCVRAVCCDVSPRARCTGSLMASSATIWW